MFASRIDRYIRAALLLVPLAIFFGRALVRDRMLAFRDTAHFYEPLFHWIRDQWHAGRMPLWNPHDNTGSPLLADVTSSLFYPGKLIFLLPMEVSLAYKLYVSGHVLLAVASTYWLARTWRIDACGATLAALAYAYGGNVLFQHCNVVFLVGAAWLPTALGFADRMLNCRRYRDAAGFSVTLALMVLGGDPQAAYHAGLLAAVYAFFLWRTEWKSNAKRERSLAESFRHLVTFRGTAPRHRFTLLACAAILATLLSAVQILPALEAARESSRGEDGATHIFSNPEPGTHARHVYEFSVGPWRWLEFFWPNIGGRMFPVDHRWMEAIPAEDRVWTPSLYLGLLPMLLGLLGSRWRSGEARDRWLSWSWLVALLASLGWFGLGWLADEIQFGVRGDPAASFGIGAPVGGVYWLLVHVLPGYEYFRYPAKTLVVASLMLSLLAGREFEHRLADMRGALRMSLGVLAMISVLAATATFFLWPTWDEAVGQFHSNTLYYGPFDAPGATLDLLAALLHTAIACVAFWFFTRGITVQNRTWRATLLLALTAADLVVAHSWLVPTAPKSPQRSEPLWLANMRGDDGASSPRVYRSTRLGPPARWRITRATDRLEENVRWEHESLYPRHHLPWRVTQVESFGSVESRDFATFLGVTRHFARKADGEEDSSQIAALLSAPWVVAPVSSNSETSTEVRAANVPANENQTATADRSPFRLPANHEFHFDMELRRNIAALPRAWIAHGWRIVPPTTAVSRRALQDATEQVLLDDQRQFRDLRQVAVVETADTALWLDRAVAAQAQRGDQSQRAAPTADSCHITREASDRVVLDVQVSSPGILVLNDLYFPGWRATVSTNGSQAISVPIDRVNRIMRGVWLTAGVHQVTFEYQPSSFLGGAVASGLAWSLLFASWLCATIQNVRKA